VKYIKTAIATRITIGNTELRGSGVVVVVVFSRTVMKWFIEFGFLSVEVIFYEDYYTTFCIPLQWINC
jgi:hypothetical protein